MALAEEQQEQPPSGAEIERNLPRVVRMLMGLRGASTGDLAGCLRIHEQSVRDRLTGKCRFTFAEVADLVEFFDVPPEVFFEDPAERLRTGSFATLLGEPIGELAQVDEPHQLRGRVLALTS